MNVTKLPLASAVDVEDWDGTGTLPLLYSKTSKGAVNVWLAWVEGNEVCVRWGQEDGAQQDARFKCEATNVGRANERDPVQQAVFEAKAKWKKQVKKKYHWDKNRVMTVRNLKPMLAKSFDKEERKVEYPVHVQPKFDGVRCLAYLKDGEVFLQSRGGDPYTVHHIMEQLQPHLLDRVILDGELYCHDTSLQAINSWVRRPQEDSKNIVYMVYDAFVEMHPELEWDSRNTWRYDMFSKYWLSGLPHVIHVQTEVANNREEVKHYHDEFVKIGYEGAIIRLKHGKYRFGYRSSELLKMKEFIDDEFEIVGWERGKGKFYNVPTFICVSPKAVDPNNNRFGATFKGTEAERAAMCEVADQQIGKQLTVRFFNYTPDGLPFHGHGIAIREPGT